ncbi:bis(5'-nucleosyl)-tetraphosphatase (symmetrical) YqeK [Leptospira sp. GIMC2001]|uniref:bis(5'-nucleosyl)-tetraphosphatase (symmetrical) YqeK n=1 Tax=Leptospira sp. GIMC2001 TaxID=1513297 RepID=UPI00234B7DAD|nr:bis(5'-nucleosyl)-tetraphosphatase (symmetrical) YqeK [Leptospira sp. GIMC2001]WCL47965.1 bis(5'-nucleosyl)-tetraphosphatase (symmetrical) YqeK [Leptospira sp. GIMC2001]
MSESKRIALYGGSFDPPHLGHRKLIEFYLDRFPSTHKVLIVPNRLSPFKENKLFLPEESLILSKINFQDINPEKIEIWDIEILKENISYSYETILAAKSLYPGYALDLLIGEDQLEDLENWKAIEIILKEISRFVVFRRNSEITQTVPIPVKMFKENFEILDNPLWIVSSSEFRMYPTGDGIYPPVFEEMKNIYSLKYNENVIKKWQGIMKGEVTETRFNHCLRVSDFAKQLALSHNYPFPEKAEIAGLIHDITKQKTDNYHLDLFQKYGFNSESIPKQSYHAFSAKYKLREMGIEDNEILNSVSYHTLGSDSMGFLAKILYVADFLGSDYALKHEDRQLWIEKSLMSLEFGMFMKSRTTMNDLIANKKSIHANTLAVYNMSINQLEEMSS